MKVPAQKLLTFGENNPILLIFILPWIPAGLLIYIARDFVGAPLGHFVTYTTLALATMFYVAFLVKVATQGLGHARTRTMRRTMRGKARFSAKASRHTGKN